MYRTRGTVGWTDKKEGGRENERREGLETGGWLGGGRENQLRDGGNGLEGYGWRLWERGWGSREEKGWGGRRGEAREGGEGSGEEGGDGSGEAGGEGIGGVGGEGVEERKGRGREWRRGDGRGRTSLSTGVTEKCHYPCERFPKCSATPFTTTTLLLSLSLSW